MKFPMRSESFPDNLIAQLQTQTSSLQGLLKAKPYLPEVIKAISNHFVASKSRLTPWELDGAFEGYLFYFHALNTVRAISVLRHLKAQIPDFNPRSVEDFGSGLGAMQLAFESVFPQVEAEWSFVESKTTVQNWHQKLLKHSGPKKAQWMTSGSGSIELFMASYSVNELGELPPRALSADTMVLIEPSDQVHSRNLAKLKPDLVRQGFRILAPCTHQGECPLLLHSRADFCHDRIELQAPDWFQKLEQAVGIKNRTLTFSYLIASKLPAVKGSPKAARVIGDTLREKGKTRQAICRSEEKEFLAWLKRHGEAQFIPHGSLVEIPETLEKKGNELRVAGVDLSISQGDLTFSEHNPKKD